MKKIILIIFIFQLLIFNISTTSSAYDLILQGSIGEMYDDNTNNSADNPHTDYITDLMLGFGINFEGRTQTLQLLGHIYQQFYYKESDLNNNSQDITLNYTKEFSERDRFILNNTFAHYPEPRNFQDMFGQPSGRNGYYTNTVNLSYDKDLISYLSINIYYRNIITRSTSDFTNDSISNGSGTRLNFSFNAFNILSLFYDYNNTQYESGEENNQQNIQHTSGLGYQHYFTQQLSVTCMGGIDYVKTHEDTQKTPYMTISIINEIDENNTINLSVSRRYQATMLTNEVYDSWIFTAVFTRDISERFSIDLNTHYQYGKIISAQADTESRLFGVTASGSYYLNENIYTRINYTHTKTINEYHIPSNYKTEFDRNQLEISINAEY